MTQRSQPIADIVTGNWSPTPVYSQLNDPYPGDSTYVTSFGSPTGDTFEVKLAEMGAPVTGAHRLTIRLRGQGAGQVAWVSLLQGYPEATPLIIKTMVFTTADALWNDYVLDLSETEIELITNYADLRVRVTVVAEPPSTSSSSESSSTSSSRSESSSSGSGPSVSGIITGCCPNVPPIIYATTINHTGDCAEQTPDTVQLDYVGVVGGNHTWSSANQPDGFKTFALDHGLADESIQIYCDEATQNWVIHFNGGLNPPLGVWSESQSTCSPLDLRFSTTATGDVAYCEGTFTVVVTD